MSTETEALRVQFEAWATAAYGLSFDDDTPLKRYLWAAYQAGHADAKAETATAGAPLAKVQCHGSAERPLYTADQLAAAEAAARISALCDTLLNRPARNAGLEIDTIREGAKEANG